MESMVERTYLSASAADTSLRVRRANDSTSARLLVLGLGALLAFAVPLGFRAQPFLPQLAPQIYLVDEADAELLAPEEVAEEVEPLLEAELELLALEVMDPDAEALFADEAAEVMPEEALPDLDAELEALALRVADPEGAFEDSACEDDAFDEAADVAADEGFTDTEDDDALTEDEGLLADDTMTEVASAGFELALVGSTFDVVFVSSTFLVVFFPPFTARSHSGEAATNDVRRKSKRTLNFMLLEYNKKKRKFELEKTETRTHK